MAAAGVLVLAGALTYAGFCPQPPPRITASVLPSAPNLASMIPKAGGEYVFLREAYGRLCAFLYG